MQLLADAQLEPLRAAGVEPRFDASELRAYGVRAIGTIDATARFALIELPTADAAPERVLGARNFYVLTRYNRSSYYAMAVYELGEALRARRSAQAGNTPVDR